MHALLPRMSSLPKSATAFSTVRKIWSRSVMSICRGRALLPWLSISFTRVPTELISRRPSATSEPACASAREIARPKPSAAPVTRETCPVRSKSGNFTIISVRTKAVEEEDQEEGDEGADGIDKRVPRRRRATDDEGLVNFVEDGITGSYGERGDGPRPTPTGASAASSTEEQQIKNEIFGKVGGFADEMVNNVDLMVCDGVEKPAEDGLDDGAGVRGRERIGRESEDDAGPGECRPPGAEPGGSQWDALAEFSELRSGARIAPGLFGQGRISSRSFRGA